MGNPSEHGFVALAFVAVALAGCLVAREDDPCAGDACDPIPLPARDIDATESAGEKNGTPATKSAPLEKADGSDAGSGGDGAAGSSPATKGSRRACNERSDCPSAAEYCCFFAAGGGAQCVMESECTGGPVFFACEDDGDCPGSTKCIAQTNTGHRACF